MRISEAIRTVYAQNGNLHRYNSIYITPSNLESFVKLIQDCQTMQGILITPFLISQDPGAVFELHYYEFDIDVFDGASHFVEYNKRNCLPSEITKNIKPKAIISPGDKQFYITALKHYISGMEKMTFADILTHYPQLQNAELFYQVILENDV